MQSLTDRPLKVPFILCLLLLLSGFQSLTAETFKGFREGRWEGPVYNKTGNSNGKGQLDVLSISAEGAVRAHLREYDGLEGEGDLSGAINVHGVMELKGVLTSPSDGGAWQSALFAVMQNDKLRFGNRLTQGSKLEEESATMSYAAALPAPPKPPGPDAGDEAIPANVYLRFVNGTDVEAWYFGARGRVFRDLREGFTQAGLDAHKPRWRGTYRLSGDQMTITADDGTIDKHTYKANKGRPKLDDSFLSAVDPVKDTQLLVGEYTHSGGYGALQSASSLTLKADGTYTRLVAGTYKADDGERFGGATDATGTWKYTTHTLTFTGSDGSVTQQLALIAPKGSMVAAVGYLYLGGKFYRQKH